MAIDPKPRTNSRQRGVLRTLFNKPFNSKLFGGKTPTQTGGVVKPKFKPNSIGRPVSKLTTVKPPKQGFTPIDDGTYTQYNSKTRQTIKYNADGSRYRRKPRGTRLPKFSLRFPGRAAAGKKALEAK